MRGLKITFYTGFALLLLLLGASLAWKLLIQRERPGLIFIGISAGLAALAVLCLVTAIAAGRGRAVSRAWLFVFSIIFFYVLADFTAGFIFIRLAPVLNVPDGQLHHRMPPRTRFVMSDPDTGADVAFVTNNMGFRGRDIGEKKPGTYRILMLGDSFTLGVNLPDTETFPHYIERILNDSPGKSFEVINLGTVSYTPLLEYLLLKKYIGILKPDMVVLNFDMSDPLQEYVYRRIAKTDERGVVTGVDGYTEYNTRINSIYVRIIMFVRQHMFVTNSIIEILVKQPENVEKLEVDVAAVVERGNRMMLLHTLDSPQLPQTAEMYRMAEDSILRAKHLCDIYSCVFILSVYPWGHQVNEKEWIPGRYDFVPEGTRVSDRTVEELREFARQYGIIFFDAFPSFRAYQGGERLYFSRDPHWTPAGQRLMAESLAGFIGEILGTTVPPQGPGQAVE